MNKAKVFVNGILAGEIQEIERGKNYRFIYLEKYSGPSVSLEMPCMKRLGLSESMIKNELLKFKESLNPWKELISNSFLSEKMRNRYVKMIDERWKRLND